MCICTLSLSRRQWLNMAALAAGGSMFSPLVAAVQDVSPAARELLQATLSVDAHSHAAGQALKPTPDTVDASIAAAMRDGGLSAICLASVPDSSLLGRDAAGKLSAIRKPGPGALYQQHLARLDWMDRMAKDHGLRRALTVADLRDAKAKGEPAFIQDIEGCDFLDGKLDRLQEAHQRGARVIQLVHYAPNDIGDYQTGPVVHNGLTVFGAQVVRELNRLGVLVDVAHALEPTVRQVLKVASRPLLLSHTALQGSAAMGDSPLLERQISPEHARFVADSGGVIGIWHFFPSVPRMVAGIKEMVDVVGVDHVAVGTDQQDARGALHDYAAFGSLATEMLASGFSATDAGKILGGNFLRVFGAAAG